MELTHEEYSKLVMLAASLDRENYTLAAEIIKAHDYNKHQFVKYVVDCIFASLDAGNLPEDIENNKAIIAYFGNDFFKVSLTHKTANSDFFYIELIINGNSVITGNTVQDNDCQQEIKLFGLVFYVNQTDIDLFKKLLIQKIAFYLFRITKQKLNENPSNKTRK